MANQAIALGVRAPQAPNLAGAMSQMVQLRNMMAQQQSAERQAAQAQQKMALDQAQEARAARSAELDDDAKIYLKHRRNAPLVRDAAGYSMFVEDIAKDDPQAARMLLQAMPPQAFDQDKFTLMLGSMDDNFAARYGKAITKEIQTADGDWMGANISGIPGASYATPIPDISRPKRPQAGVAPAPNAVTAPTAAPAYQPGQPTATDVLAKMPANLRNIIVNAQQTGVINSQDLKTLGTALGNPGVRMLQDFILNNNIQLQDEAPGVRPMSESGIIQRQLGEGIHGEYDAPSFRTAEYRPDQGAPAFEPAQYDPNAYETVRGKPPMQSPMPGSAMVPIPRVRAEAQAQRETPGEAAAKAGATAAATATVTREEKQRERQPAKQQVTTLVNKIRNAYEQLNKAEAIPSEKRGGFANFFDYLATTGAGREVQRMVGTQSSKHLSAITNSRKLLATAIKNATGMSAQEMNSNTELQLMLDALTDPTQGIEAARSTLDTIQELYGAPQSGGGKRTPTKGAKAPASSGWGTASVVGD